MRKTLCQPGSAERAGSMGVAVAVGVERGPGVVVASGFGAISHPTRPQPKTRIMQTARSVCLALIAWPYRMGRDAMSCSSLTEYMTVELLKEHSGKQCSIASPHR